MPRGLRALLGGGLWDGGGEAGEGVVAQVGGGSGRVVATHTHRSLAARIALVRVGRRLRVGDGAHDERRSGDHRSRGKSRDDESGGGRMGEVIPTAFRNGQEPLLLLLRVELLRHAVFLQLGNAVRRFPHSFDGGRRELGRSPRLLIAAVTRMSLVGTNGWTD